MADSIETRVGEQMWEPNDPPRVPAITGPVDASVVPRFAGLATFARLPVAGTTTCDVGVLGIPFDSGVSYRPGARFGPSHVRESSRLLRGFNAALDVEPFTAQVVADLGDLAVNPFSIQEAIEQIEIGYRQASERAARIATIGGDHTVVLPILRTLFERHGPIAVVHLDAHLDTWDTYLGARYTHGTTFLRAAEEGLLARDHCMHVGIRGPLYSRDDLTRDANCGFELVTAMDMADSGWSSVAEAVRSRTDGYAVYLSIDIDVLDPACAPGTGTPEAGGLQSREVLALIRAMTGLPLVGMDVVEVAPAYDHSQITGIAAAHLLYEGISLWAQGGRTP